MGTAIRRSFCRLPALMLAVVLCALLSGCEAEPSETTIFAMDTIMTLTVYGRNSEAALNQAVEQIYTLEDLLAVTDPDSEIYAINHAHGNWTDISPETTAVLEGALQLCALTEGALDITAFSAVQAWGFTTGEYRVPGQEELDALAAGIDYAAVELDTDNCRVRLPEGMELDLGAVAKGYTGQLLAGLLQEAGVSSATLSLGGNVQAVGAKPGGSPWRVGIQNPSGDSYLAVVEVIDQAVVTSGGYQRYFEENGQRYWHIMDPDTASPARSGLTSVTVIGSSGLECDGLSTALFVMGMEKGTDFWRTHPELGFEVVFISDDGNVFITAGLEDSFSLAQSYEGQEVTVLS